MGDPALARPHHRVGAFNWRDYDADTGRFTALDPLREKGGDKDWYGYCVEDPVNRVDAWGLAWSLFGGGSEPAAADGGQESPKPRTGRDDNPYCKDNPCDDNGTMQGDYRPIEGREGVPPFIFQLPFDPVVDAFYIPWKKCWFDKK